MKETVKINLGQRLFDLDKDAYEKLKVYLETLKKFFRKSPDEADEIMQDIEQRIADLLIEKQSEKKQIITVDDVEEAIQLMGTVEDFEIDEKSSEEYKSSDKSDTETGTKESRRLHRDIDNNLLGGVCSGIAAYFDVDKVWIRLAFVLLFILKGAGLIAYLILWLVVPAARTTAQKLQMHGRAVNVENIEQSVKDEYNKIRDNAKKYTEGDSYRRMQSSLSEIISVLGTILLMAGRIILTIIGISFAIVGIILILGLVSVIPIAEIPFWPEIDPYLHNFTFYTFLIIILISIPVIAIFIATIRYIFNIRKENHVLSAFIWTTWSLALVFIILVFISGKKIIDFEEKLEDQVLLKIKDNKTLTVKIEDNNITSNRLTHYNVFGRKILYDREEETCYVQPKFYISNSNDSFCYLHFTKSSRIPFDNEESGYNTYDYRWNLNDTILLLNQYFSVYEDNIWTLPGLEVNLKIPKGKRVIMIGDANIYFDRLFTKADTISGKEIFF